MSKYTSTIQNKTKSRRQSRLLEIVKTRPVSTQTKLAQLLASDGISCTQVSISRDIRELGLVKRNGRYHGPSEAKDLSLPTDLADKISGFLIGAEIIGENLVVVRTIPGTAHSVSMFLDQAAWPGVAGSIAGDDTIFVAVRSSETGQLILANLDEITITKK
jgi:transcriptional regulator of arginine metabolism